MSEIQIQTRRLIIGEWSADLANAFYRLTLGDEGLKYVTEAPFSSLADVQTLLQYYIYKSDEE